MSLLVLFPTLSVGAPTFYVGAFLFVLDEKTFTRTFSNSDNRNLEGIQTGPSANAYAFASGRFEPSSRTFLNGEQPYAWDLLQPRAKVSRHRGAELRRRYGRLGGTSLLSPG